VEVEETPDGYALTFPNLPGLRPAGGSLVETHTRLDWMGHQGVRTQYLAAWLDIQGYSLLKDKEAQWVRLLNEHIAQTALERSSQFKGLAAVPLRDGRLAAQELEHAVTSLDGYDWGYGSQRPAGYRCGGPGHGTLLGGR
jgi:predicted TIM-barrel fold metal-dependent hydrolase